MPKNKKTVKSIEEYLYNAIDNIETDRASAHVLLTDLMIYLKQDPGKHERNGLVAAKYLETLQRSNEQLVKAIELMHKRESKQNQESVEINSDEILDELQGE